MMHWLSRHENTLQWLLMLAGLVLATKIMSMFYGSLTPPKPVWETVGVLAAMGASYALDRAVRPVRPAIIDPPDGQPAKAGKKPFGVKCRNGLCLTLLTIGLFVILVRISEYHRPREFYLLGPLFIGYFSLNWLLGKIPWMRDRP